MCEQFIREKPSLSLNVTDPETTNIKTNGIKKQATHAQEQWVIAPSTVTSEQSNSSARLPCWKLALCERIPNHVKRPLSIHLYWIAVTSLAKTHMYIT